MEVDRDWVLGGGVPSVCFCFFVSWFLLERRLCVCCGMLRWEWYLSYCLVLSIHGRIRGYAVSR